MAYALYFCFFPVTNIQYQYNQYPLLLYNIHGTKQLLSCTYMQYPEPSHQYPVLIFNIQYQATSILYLHSISSTKQLVSCTYIQYPVLSNQYPVLIFNIQYQATRILYLYSVSSITCNKYPALQYYLTSSIQYHLNIQYRVFCPVSTPCINIEISWKMKTTNMQKMMY